MPCMIRVHCILLVAAVALLAGCGDEGTMITDTVSPSRVEDLQVVAVGETTVTLTWTDSGDDGMVGRADSYDLRYDYGRISPQHWIDARRVTDLPPVGAPGDRQEFTVTDVSPNTTWYFALRILDNAGNSSPISNQVTARPGVPVCVVEPSELHFGRTPMGREPEAGFTMEFVIRNDGGGTAEGDVSLDCDFFSITSGAGPLRLFAGQSRTVGVTFLPLSVEPVECLVGTGTTCGPVTATGTGFQPEESLVLIDVGAGVTFLMGSPREEPGRLEDESRRMVTLTQSFWVSRHEVTQAEWRGVMPWDESAFAGADLPVESITWYDAVEYCNLLSRGGGRDPAYRLSEVSRRGNRIESAEVFWDRESNGYRLLTEAEWEYICRAGSDQAFYTGGIIEPSCAPIDPNLHSAGWYCGNSDRMSRPVGGKAPNGFGLYDLHGNVYEWCYDFYAPDYGAGERQVLVDPVGPDEGISRVARGGGWVSPASECRSASRFYQRPGDWYPFVGFRVARNHD